MIAGTGQCTYDGDGPATQHSLCQVADIAVDASGNVFIADICLVREVDTNGNMKTIAGYVTPQNVPECLFNGDGPATTAAVNTPSAIALDGQGNLYIADTGNDRLRVLSLANSTITTVAGSGMLLNGQCIFDGDGPALQHSLCAPNGVALDASGNVFVIDSGNVRIREISNGNITTLAGNGKSDFAGENAPASTAIFDHPTGIAVDHNGDVYVADQYNNRIRELSQTSTFVVSAGQPTLTLTAGGSGTVTLQVTAAKRLQRDSFLRL